MNRTRMVVYFTRLLSRLLLLLFVSGNWPYPAKAQTQPSMITGQILDQVTRSPLGYVSVYVLRYPFGTVSDDRGNFALNLPASYDTDSVRFSLLGYGTRTITVADLREQARRDPLLLHSQAIQLAAAQVRATGLQRRILGNQGGGMLSGFNDNMAGNQIGQHIVVKQAGMLQEVSFKISHCTYDTVYLRLNIYQVKNDFPGANILSAPVYLRVSRNQIENRIYLNLRPQKVWFDEDVIIALELVRSLGQGTLTFLATWPGGGPSYKLQQTPGPSLSQNIAPKGTIKVHLRDQKQPNNGPWTKFPGMGVGIEATLLQMTE